MKIIKKIKEFYGSTLDGIKVGYPLKQFCIFLSKDEVPVYWWPGNKNKNFGDVITPYLVEKISGKRPIWANRYCLRDYYMVTGSVISLANKHSIIWGSGIISKDQYIRKPKNICAVRGPLTRKRVLKLGYQCPEIYGDPGLLLPLFYKSKVKKKYELGIIPHYVDYAKIKGEIKENKVLVINLLDPIEKVIDNICSCKMTISSSLHGIITSHAYNIPSMWVKFSDKLGGDGTKFKDYLLSVKLRLYEPLNLKKGKINTKKIIAIIKQRHNKKISINYKKLLESCPFKNDSKIS